MSTSGGIVRTIGHFSTSFPRVVVLVVLLLGSSSSSTLAQVVSPDLLVTGDTDVQSEPDVASVGSNLVALWFSQSGFSSTAWSSSTDRGSTWSPAASIPLANYSVDRTRAHPVICSDRHGNFHAAVAYNSGVLQAQETIATYRGRFQNRSFGWEGPVWGAPLVPYSDLGPFDSIDIASSPVADVIFVAYSFARRVPGGAEYSINLVRSLDDGLTWTSPFALSGPASNGPNVEVGPNGEVYVSWVDYSSMTVKLRRSLDQGASFEPATDIAPLLDNLGTPPPGSINPFSPRIVPTFPKAGLDSDFPSLTVDRSLGPRRGSLYLTWSEYATGTVGPSTATISEVEPNDTYSTAMPIAVGQDVEGSESSGDFGGADCDHFTFLAEAGTTLWIDGVLTFAWPSSPQGPVRSALQLHCGEDPDALASVTGLTIQEEQAGALPPCIYTVPRTGRYYLSVACASYYVIGYRMRLRTLSPNAGQVTRDHRDIVMVRSSDGGQTWSSKVRINDSPPQFDDCLPRTVVDMNGTVHVAWYDRQEDPGCGLDTHTRWTRSIDGGQTFAPSVRLSSGSGPGYRIGDHLGMATSGNTLHVLWTDNRAGDEVDIYAASISDLATGTLISGLSIERQGESVRLSWDLQAQATYVAFEVDRLAPTAERVARVPLQGPGRYEAWDPEVRAGAVHSYALVGVTPTGAREPLAEASLEIPGRAIKMAWTALPNPVIGYGRFTLTMPRTMAGQVEVYDVAGHRVRTLRRGLLAAGDNPFEWTGQNDAGDRLPAGVYLLQARAEGQIATGRFIQIR